MRFFVFASCLLFAFNACAADNRMEVQEISTRLGIKALLVENHSNPVVSVQVAFRTGGAHDPTHKQSLSDLYAALLDKGAGGMDAGEFAQALYEKSIRLGFDAGKEQLHVSMQTLRENYIDAFGLMKTALSKTHFKQDEIDKAKEELRTSIRMRRERPRAEAINALFREAFGSHPYGYGMDEAEKGLENVSRYDLLQYGQRLGRDNIIIGVSGDINASEVRNMVERTFDFLSEKSVNPEIPVPEFHASPEPVRVDRQVQQGVIAWAAPWVPRRDRDFFTAYVLNHILGGGGLDSVLMRELREKRGLTYGIGTSLSEFDRIFLMVGFGGIDARKVSEALAATREVLGGFKVTEAELRDAKDYLTGSFALQFMSTAAVAGMLVTIEKHGLGYDYFDRRNGYIEAVTLADINRVARERLDLGKALFVTMGE